MFFLITGEGNSDVGYQTSSPGPLINALEVLSAEVSDETFSYEIINRSTLAESARISATSKKQILSRGSKRKKAGLAYVSRQAQAIAEKAQKSTNTGAVQTKSIMLLLRLEEKHIMMDFKLQLQECLFWGQH